MRARPRNARVAFALLCAVALTNAVAVAFVVPRSGALVTTYAGSSELASALDLATGLGLLAAGMLAWHERLGGSLGPLSALASIVWFAPNWIGWEGGPPLARSIGMVVVPLGVAIVLHLALAAPRGRLARGPARVAVAVAYALAVVIATGLAMFRDPFEDLECWSNCSENVFLVDADRGVADVFAVLGPVTALVGGAVIAVVAGWRLVRATGPARRTLTPVLGPAALVGAAEAAYAITLLRLPVEDPDRSAFAFVFVCRAASLTVLAAGIAWTAVRARRMRAAVAHLRVEGERAPLREILAGALGDPALDVAYPLPGSGRPVDESGAPVELPPAGSGRAITRILRDGDPVALVAHDASLLDGPALAREIGAAATLAVDNERLQASVLAQLADLRASRTRIVETGDAARRQLERDLHDGAQQRLLALSYELRLALADAHAGGDDELVTLMTEANEQARTALADLRDLAHGIYPAILAEAGLEAALFTAADSAPLPVELGSITSGRYAASIETAAYVVVAAGIEDAVRRRATYVGVEVAPHGERLVVRVHDDGSGRRIAAQHLIDRIGALGGRLEEHPDRVEAEIPCA